MTQKHLGRKKITQYFLECRLRTWSITETLFLLKTCVCVLVSCKCSDGRPSLHHHLLPKAHESSWNIRQNFKGNTMDNVARHTHKRNFYFPQNSFKQWSFKSAKCHLTRILIFVIAIQCTKSDTARQRPKLSAVKHVKKNYQTLTD